MSLRLAHVVIVAVRLDRSLNRNFERCRAMPIVHVYLCPQGRPVVGRVVRVRTLASALGDLALRCHRRDGVSESIVAVRIGGGIGPYVAMEIYGDVRRVVASRPCYVHGDIRDPVEVSRPAALLL